jgi:hypothetical protein
MLRGFMIAVAANVRPRCSLVKTINDRVKQKRDWFDTPWASLLAERAIPSLEVTS